MESSPLLLAHTHARNALHETRKSNPVAASEEHDLAAGEFATARLSITDPSAARTLRLLEDHHKQLAAIIRFQHENPPSAAEAERKLSGGAEELAPNPTASPVAHRASGLTAGPQYQQQHHSKQQHHHQQQQYVQHPPRLLSQTSSGSRNSSIAGNLASARGIPSQRQHANPVSPTVSAQNARARMAGSPVQARQRDGRRADQLSTDPQASPQNRSREGNRSWGQPISPTRVTAQEYVSPYIKDTAIAGLKSITGDEPFKRFYSTFEGVISKLSAPLAFASLPLGVDGASQPRLLSGQKAPAADTKTDTDAAVADFTSFSDKDPDVSKLISSAALRAIKDKDGHFGSHNPAESFYVVPTTGGMISYAGILSREEKEAVKDSLESVEDDFVDASENPPSPEDLVQKGAGKLDRSTTLPPRKNKGDPSRSLKTVEELHMENEALRHLSDTLAKRLHMWEVNAQSSSLALQQSIRAMHNQHAILPSLQTSPAASTTGEPMSSAVPGAASDMRIRELQELIKNNERELEKVSRENEKLRAVVERYRERWEKLKEGARVRREGAGNGNGNGNGRPSKDDSKERAEEEDTNNNNKQGD